MSWLVALNAAGRFLAAILNVGVVESDLTDGVVRDGESRNVQAARQTTKFGVGDAICVRRPRSAR